jgi:hypothetical protein
MRGMHRLLAAILLAGAVGGVAVFARHLGRVPEPLTARLSAPPPQHLTAPGAVHAPLLVPARPAGPFGAVTNALRPARQAATAPLALSAARPLTVPRVTTRQPAPPTVGSPATTPVAAPATVPEQEPVRVLAAVPLTPAASTATTVLTPNGNGNNSSNGTAAQPGNGKGHAYGHAKHAKAGKSTSDLATQAPAFIPATPEPLTPVSQPASVVELTPVDPDGADADAEQVVHGHGWARGNSKGHRG